MAHDVFNSGIKLFRPNLGQPNNYTAYYKP